MTVGELTSNMVEVALVKIAKDDEQRDHVPDHPIVAIAARTKEIEVIVTVTVTFPKEGRRHMFETDRDRLLGLGLTLATDYPHNTRLIAGHRNVFKVPRTLVFRSVLVVLHPANCSPTLRDARVFLRQKMEKARHSTRTLPLIHPKSSHKCHKLQQSSPLERVPRLLMFSLLWCLHLRPFPRSHGVYQDIFSVTVLD
jgi:hypothetical protein